MMFAPSRVWRYHKYAHLDSGWSLGFAETEDGSGGNEWAGAYTRPARFSST
jgi:hypothetical protein